jgi:hypothetical protein
MKAVNLEREQPAGYAADFWGIVVVVNDAEPKFRENYKLRSECLNVNDAETPGMERMASRPCQQQLQLHSAESETSSLSDLRQDRLALQSHRSASNAGSTVSALILNGK